MSLRFSHSLLVLLVFALLGPVVGAIVTGILLTLFSMLADPRSGMNFILPALAFLPLAYLIGGAQAFITGIITAIRVWRHGNAPLWIPMLVSLISAVIIQIRSFEQPDMAALMIAVHLISAALCWLSLRYTLDWHEVKQEEHA